MRVSKDPSRAPAASRPQGRKHRTVRLPTLTASVLALALGLSSCLLDFRDEKQDASPERLLRLESGWVAGYSLLRRAVFAPRCISCHGSKGGVNLETYESARSWATGIAQAVLVDRTMPPGGGLSEVERAAIRAWVDAGAPAENTQIGGPQPSPSPSASPSPSPSPTDPVEPVTFERVKRKIFQPRCFRCHKAGEELELGDESAILYENVIANLMKIEKAALIEKTMPRRNGKPDPLGEEDQALLRAWIDGGAPR